jgi:hypothetical protein
MPSLMVLPVHSQKNSPAIARSLHVEMIDFQPLGFDLDWTLGFF